MNSSNRILVLLTALFTMGFLSAQDKQNSFNPVSTSVTSQSIAPDARAAGMGDVGAATDPDVNSQYWNPAKYPFTISRAGVALNYTPWLRQLVNDMDLAYLSGYYRIGNYSAVSASLRYFSMGEVYMSDQVDDAGNVAPGAATINPYEMSLDVAYSLMLNEHFSDTIFVTISSGAVVAPYLYLEMQSRCYSLLNCLEHRPGYMNGDLGDIMNQLYASSPDIFIAPTSLNYFLQQL